MALRQLTIKRQTVGCGFLSTDETFECVEFSAGKAAGKIAVADQRGGVTIYGNLEAALEELNKKGESTVVEEDDRCYVCADCTAEIIPLLADKE